MDSGTMAGCELVYLKLCCLLVSWLTYVLSSQITHIQPSTLPFICWYWLKLII